MADKAPPPPETSRERMLALLGLLVQSLFRLAVDAITPKFLGDNPEDVKKLTSRIWPMVETIIALFPASFTDTLRGLNKTILEVSQSEVGVLGAEVAEAWHQILDDIFTAYRTELAADKSTNPADADKIMSAALARASYLGVGSAMVTVLFETVLPKQLNFMNWLGPTLAQLSGYKEIVAFGRQSQYKHAFGNLAEYDAANTFLTRAPGGNEAADLAARGLINTDQRDKLLGWSGLMAEFQPAIAASRFRPVSPRALATAFVDVPFPTDDVRSMMEFAGNRPDDIVVMLDAFEQRSTQNVRQQYVAALTAAAENGVMTSDQLKSALEGQGFSPDAVGFVLLTVAVKRLQILDTLYRRSVSEAYKFGQISDADYVPHLEAIGIEEADADAHYTIDSIAKNGKAAIAAQKAAASEASKEQRAAVAGATESYKSGQTTAAELAASLLAAGLAPALVVYAVQIATARRAGALRLVYGQLLAPADAEVLRPGRCSIILRI